MADNILLNVGAGGSRLATAQLAFSGDTADFQICGGTILTGAEGAWTQTLIVGGAGAVTDGVQRVTLASDDPAVAKLTTIDVDTGAIATSVASVDGKITACNTGATVISALPADTFAADAQAYGKGVLIQGDDGIDRRALLVGTDGHLQVDVLSAPTTAVTGTFWQATQPVSGTFWQATQPVSGTFYQATQPVSAAALPLPSGAATSALQGGGLPAALGAGGGLKVDGSGTALPVSGTFYQATQPVSAASLPLPSGAATSTLQGGGLPAALGSGGGLKIDGSGTGLPVVSQQSTSAVYDGTTSCTLKRVSTIATASGINSLIAAVADKKFRVLALGVFATSTTAVSFYLYNVDYMLLADSTNKLTVDLDGVGGPAGFVLPFNPAGWFQTDAVNEALSINLSAATPVVVLLSYIEVA